MLQVLFFLRLIQLKYHCALSQCEFQELLHNPTSGRNNYVGRESKHVMPLFTLSVLINQDRHSCYREEQLYER